MNIAHFKGLVDYKTLSHINADIITFDRVKFIQDTQLIFKNQFNKISHVLFNIQQKYIISQPYEFVAQILIDIFSVFCKTLRDKINDNLTIDNFLKIVYEFHMRTKYVPGVLAIINKAFHCSSGNYCFVDIVKLYVFHKIIIEEHYNGKHIIAIINEQININDYRQLIYLYKTYRLLKKFCSLYDQLSLNIPSLYLDNCNTDTYIESYVANISNKIEDIVNEFDPDILKKKIIHIRDLIIYGPGIFTCSRGAGITLTKLSDGESLSSPNIYIKHYRTYMMTRLNNNISNTKIEREFLLNLNKKLDEEETKLIFKNLRDFEDNPSKN